MAATMTKIAQEAGVSVAVVSRLLRGDRTLRISDERRRLILDISDRVGGVRVRQSKRTLTKAIVMPVNRRFVGTWVAEQFVRSSMFRWTEMALREAGFILNLTPVDHEQRVSQLGDLIRSGTACDGFVFSSSMVNDELGQLVRDMRFPHVCSSLDAERFQVCTVTAHAADGLRQAVEHLQQLGHRRIGFFGTRDHARFPVVVASLVAAGLPVSEHQSCWLETNHDTDKPHELRQEATNRMRSWLDQNLAPTAFICGNDVLAFGACDAIRQKGMTPGKEISIVGFDNIEEHGEVPAETPQLTTIDWPPRVIGTRAAQLLLNQILHGQTQIVHERIPTRLIVRSSTGPACR